MAWTQADIERLEHAISTGARSVQLNGERVEYRSLAEMRATLEMMRASVGGRTRAGAFAVTYPRTTRGL